MGDPGYQGRESTSTRNPHSASVAPATLHSKRLAKLSYEERVLSQWRAAFGCPVSDEAKVKFTVYALGKTFNLSDARLWTIHHPQTQGKDPNASEKGIIYMEFFFDGSQNEIVGHEEEFTKSFERMIEEQLQEQRLSDFRRKLAARRRGGGRGVGKRGSEGSENEGQDMGGVSDSDWQAFLRRPAPTTDLSVRSMREAGCMLRFLVCQTSLSVSASEALGQIAFQEHFPIDGVAQDISQSKTPMPKWFYGIGALTTVLALLFLLAWWHVLRKVIFGHPTGST